jgi:hypothetical protein
MEKAKFKVGDTLVRIAYKNDLSIVSRDEIEIIDIVSDFHPICPSLWYVCVDYRGRVKHGLVGVIDDAFCLKQ